MDNYKQRDTEQLHPYYFNHVSAMTGEKLHSKAAIAAELAYRDMLIHNLKKCLSEAVDLMEDVYSGDYSPDSFTTQPWITILDSLIIGRD